MMNISDEAIQDAVWDAQREIFKPEWPPHNMEEFIRVVSEISTKAVLNLLGANKKGATDIVQQMDFPVVFAEWAQQFALKTHHERFLAAMFYLREREDVRAVSTAEIAAMYTKARWKKPANLADTFAKGAERLLFAEAEGASPDGLKLWTLTRTGYEHLMSLKMEV